MTTRTVEVNEDAAALGALAESLVHLGRNWVWDIGADRLYWSDELFRVYGIDPETFDGRCASVSRLVHPEDAGKRERAIDEVLRGESVEPFEYRVVRPDGSERTVLVKELQLYGGTPATPRYMVGIVQDITELRQLEEQLTLLSADLETRVHDRTAELELANERLQELDRLKSMFIAMTSHELRTPLNSILGFVSMTLHGMSGELNEEQKDNLSRAHASARHLLSLVNDVIDISKLEAGKTEVYPEGLLLADVVREAASGLEPEIRSKGLTLETAVLPEIALYTDRKRLLQCLINLIGNAVKFTDRGGISVTADRCGDQVLVSVADSGIGMGEGAVARLFQPFEQLETPMRLRAGGTGLGLYLTSKLCTDVLKGSIAVQSRVGEGSTFTMSIPKDLRTCIDRQGA